MTWLLTENLKSTDKLEIQSEFRTAARCNVSIQKSIILLYIGNKQLENKIFKCYFQ